VKYTVKLGSGAMIHVPSFRNIGSGIQKLIGRNTQILVYIETQTIRQQCDLISLLLF
jgi:hypothetical protein